MTDQFGYASYDKNIKNIFEHILLLHYEQKIDQKKVIKIILPIDIMIDLLGANPICRFQVTLLYETIKNDN